MQKKIVQFKLETQMAVLALQLTIKHFSTKQNRFFPITCK